MYCGGWYACNIDNQQSPQYGYYRKYLKNGAERMSALLFTNNDWTINVNLTKTINDVESVFDASGGVVQASIVKLDGNEPCPVIPATTQIEAALGADWANGLIVVVFPKAATVDITNFGTLYLELKVTKAGKDETWPREAVIINKGSIA